MADELIVEDKQEETPSAASFFNSENWKSSPTELSIVEDKIEENIAEKVEEKVEEKVSEITTKVVEEKIEESAFKFANEESEKVFNLLKEGKKDEVLSILAEQDKLAKADKLTPAEAIKLNLQYQNKDFTPTEINDLFEERYEMPEKPEQGDTELDEEFEARTKKYNEKVEKIQAKIARDAKPAIAELQKLQKEIVLPDIPKVENFKEPTQEELDAQKLKADNFFQSVEQSVNKFDGYTTTFKDEEVELSVAYKLTKEEKAQIQPLINLSETNAAEFLKAINWLDDKGDINVSKLVEDLPIILNKGKVFEKIASETGNRRMAEATKSIKNIDYSGGKSGAAEMGKQPAQLQSEFANHFFQNS